MHGPQDYTRPDQIHTKHRHVYTHFELPMYSLAMAALRWRAEGIGWPRNSLYVAHQRSMCSQNKYALKTRFIYLFEYTQRITFRSHSGTCKYRFCAILSSPPDTYERVVVTAKIANIQQSCCRPCDVFLGASAAAGLKVWPNIKL